MQKSRNISKNSSLRQATQQSLRRLGLSSQITTGQQTSPVIFPEKRNSRGKPETHGDISVTNDDLKKAKVEEHRIDIGDEQCDLLGYEVFSGKLSLDKRKSSKHSEVQTSENMNFEMVDVKLTSKALIWGSEMLRLDDVVSLSYCVGLRHFTVHAYPLRKSSCGLFVKTGRSQKDFRFFASTSEDALQWVNTFADQQCYVNSLPHPMASKKQCSDSIFNEFPPESYIRCKSPPKVLVILNPRSGHGRSSKVFQELVEPIFKLAGFELEVVKTTSAGHARKLAASVDFSTCPDGIICIGGDGIINEVLNGLLSRDNQREATTVPIGIIPAGSDNSLVWTVLGVRDPVSAALAIVKGGLTAIDVFAVKWIHAGAVHFGTTVTYFGFVSDVLELSGKYQKRFGPLRYFVAGFLKFFCLPKYSYEVEYLPSQRVERKISSDREIIDMSELYTDIMRRSSKEGLPRASSLSSIDSIMTTSQMSGADFDTTCSSTEPSEYVRAIDAKSKRLSASRRDLTAEPEVIHPQLPHSVTPNWPRTRSKSRTDKAWTGPTATKDLIRSSWGNTITNDKEDISSTMSDPGPIWDAEPRWDSEPNWDIENPIELPGPPDDSEAGNRKETVSKSEENWVVTKGRFLGVMVCNHSCKTVQSLSSQVVAPKAEHNDNSLDLLLVHGSGRLRLLRFLLCLQVGTHVSLPYVEYVKVKSVRIKPGKRTHNGCGIDGELFPANGQVVCSLLPRQCRLIGRSSCSNN
ncbi:UNVERIFIED_CONTAM: Sphingoid long-chain bases kinase [Sesamum latifolium]|uniref:Sphingoid long-chain bases kinase n=1 Tax=Sesamum latifolium TaxID=2727402 RepID=A0AAW2YEZ6_9LAMI